MAGARKLQAEIDRTLKRVDEGLEVFDDLYEQQKGCEGQALKLKYEEDLKKEIKKLQKLREQVKAWASSSEIKNKQPLLDARHKIEERMAQFKVVERDTKTKAYSKEGLMRDKPMTEEEKKRMKSREWVQEIVNKLSDEVELLEGELEALENAENKPKLKKGEKDPAQVLEVVIKNHHFHIDKLEALTRLLDNAVVEAEAVDALKDDLDYYVTSAREPDYEADLELYAEFDDVIGAEAAANGDDDDDDADEDDDDGSKGKAAAAAKTKAAPAPAPAAAEKPKTAAPATPAAKAATAAAPAVVATEKGKATAVPAAATAAAATKAPVVAKTTLPVTPVKVPIAASAPVAPSAISLAAVVTGQAAAPASATAPAAAPAAAPVKPAESLAAIVRGKAAAEAAPAPPAASAAASSSAQPLFQLGLGPSTAAVGAAGKPSAITVPVSTPSATPATVTPGTTPALAILQRGGAPAASAAAGSGAAAGSSTVDSGADASHAGSAIADGIAAIVGTPAATTPSLSSAAGSAASRGGSAPAGAAKGSASAAGTSAAAAIGTKAGVPVVGGRNDGSAAVAAAAAAAAITIPEAVLSSAWAPMSVQQARYCATVVTNALATLPEAGDCQLPRPYAPRQPHPTHPSFPTTPAPSLETPSLFESFENDTLFFIFYFAQGQYSQYLAAKELKKTGWRFNKKFGTWFLRQEEPSRFVYGDGPGASEQAGGEPIGEVGNYAYFDYESGWATRIKKDFTFEYAHMEDA